MRAGFCLFYLVLPPHHLEVGLAEKVCKELLLDEERKSGIYDALAPGTLSFSSISFNLLSTLFLSFI